MQSWAKDLLHHDNTNMLTYTTLLWAQARRAGNLATTCGSSVHGGGVFLQNPNTRMGQVSGCGMQMMIMRSDLGDSIDRVWQPKG